MRKQLFGDGERIRERPVLMRVIRFEHHLIEADAPSPDVAYIETVRCNSCNECTTLNGKMFAYNDEKQAVIADLTAGSYRQLVEAAEKCQVAIIHPGKPTNPDEPGLEELVQRAAAFM